MHGFEKVFLCSLLGSVAARQRGDGPDPTVARFAKSYIVEFNAGKSARLSSLASEGDVKIVKSFDSEIFTGASVETNELNLDSLLDLPDVVNVWPNNPVYLDPIVQQDESSAAVPSIVHTVTGVSKLHEQGIYGKGVKVGVVDTGIWYNHEALGGGFGEGFKVAGGHDFVGDQYWPSIGYEKEPDKDPIDLSGHGTHVAGIIAGKSDDFTGVAPDATLYAYKVMTRQGGTDAATLIESFIAAYNDGVDIITSSIGGAGGWAEEAWAVVASRLVEQGVVVTISAANSGSQGAFYGSSGSSGKNVLAVASADALAVNTTRASSFTSWGLLNDLSVKPDITAPGGSIYSTYLNNGWTTMSGTSMSCPYVAGVAALYISASGGRQVHGKDFALSLSKQIIASAKPLAYHNPAYSELAAPVAQVGNGLIDAYKLLHSNITLDFKPIALNDTRYFNRYHDITVKNMGSEPVTYHLSAQDVYGVDTLALDTVNGDKRVRLLSELAPKKLPVEISLPRDFILSPGDSKTVSVNFKNPESLGWSATVLPLYSGKIIVAGNNGEELSVPYAGVAGDLRKELDPLFRKGHPYLVSGEPAQTGKTSFTFNLTLGVQDFPKIFHNIIWGTRQVRWDIFEAGWTERQWAYPPVVGEKGYIGSGAYWVGSGQAPFFDPTRWDPDETLSYPKIDLPRSNFNFENWWFGKLANGTKLSLGNYVLRYAALKPFGTPDHSDNWVTFTTPIEVLGQY
ncbi:subtilase [Colletotrichum truncatum]|uniref:Subtilase n=1 Tax=Colletotrichum truncatum TaxID=5467 RepID=A0ACC3YWP1_COLTU|nr:subtilase [Colletotrichum truncatum]KAF6787532.1 subtilase [Colletotrichum truncatum]